jgi:hypothetical protein
MPRVEARLERLASSNIRESANLLSAKTLGGEVLPV